MEEEAQAIIRALDLAPHPEGGWYKETWRAEPLDGDSRSAGTAIYFLLEEGQRSHWHRVDAVELWLWHAGAALELLIEQRGGEIETRTLGGDGRAAIRRKALFPPITGRPRKRVSAGPWSAAWWSRPSTLQASNWLRPAGHQRTVDPHYPRYPQGRPRVLSLCATRNP